MPDFGGNPYSGFGNDKGVEREKRTYQPQREEEIFSNNFGGLNTISSLVNCPYEDSPLLINTRVDVSGNVIKRSGTKVVFNQNISTNGLALIPFTTGLQYNYLVIKNLQELGVYEVINDVVTKIITKSNVFTQSASSIRPTFAKTAEVEPRIILCTGTNAPVQLRFVEQSSSVNFGGGSTSAVISNAARFVNATTSNILVYIDRVRQTGWGVSYNSGTKQLTITGLPNTTGTHTVDICLVVWQWFTEAFFYRGNRFWQSATRFNAITGVDNSVAVDQNLRDSIADESPSNPNFYPLRAWKSTNWGDTFNRATNLEPSDNNTYATSDGSSYNYYDNVLGSPCTHTAGRKVNPSPLFITFGYVNNASTASGTCGVASQTVPNNSSSQMFISRRRLFSFNGNNGVTGANLTVRVNGTIVPQSLTLGSSNATYGSYWLITPTYSTYITDTTTISGAIEFVAAAQMGLPADAKVELINTEVKGIGSSGVNSSDTYNDGSWLPEYGLGNFADYNTGSYPKTVTIYQGRLVFGGFPEQPLTVCCSNVYDSVTPGSNFSSFQIDTFANSDSDALSFVLASSPNDQIKNVIEWRNSLFCFTRNAAFRAFGNSGTLSQTDRLISLISNQGLVNANCVCKTDKNILFLTDVGIYNLVTTLSTGGTEFLAGEQSVKIRNYFGITTNPAYESLPWMAYDSTNQIMYLGYPIANSTYTTHKILAYNTYRESWTEYYTPGYFQVFNSAAYVDRALGYGFISACCTYRSSGVPTNLVLLKWNDTRYIDFAQYSVSVGGSQVYNTTPQNIVSFTTQDRVLEYGTILEVANQGQSFVPIPIINLEDMIVTLNGLRLTFQNDWVKMPNGNIYLRANPGSGKTLTIRVRRPVTDNISGQVQYGVSAPIDIEHTLVFVDNIFKKETVDYTVGVSAGVYQVTITSAANANVVVGQAYPVYYFSPMFARLNFGTGKRVIHVYALFDNTDGLATFQASDVNTASGQTAEQVTGIPQNRLDCSIGVVYNGQRDGELDYDIYGYSDLVWDDAIFDVDPSAYQYQRYALFKESVQGLGYAYQLVLFSFDESVFKLAAYMIGAKLKADRYIFFSS